MVGEAGSNQERRHPLLTEHQEPPLLAQFRQRAIVILRTEGIIGLMRRIAGRLRRKPLSRSAYVLALRLDHPIKRLSPKVEVAIERVSAEDRDTIEVLAEIDEWGSTVSEMLNWLTEGVECYVAKHDGQIASVEWCRGGEIFDEFLERRFQLGANEAYFFGGVTPPPLRGKGIHPYLQAECARDIATRYPHKTHILTFVGVNNKASLHSLTKAGFHRVGRVGFVEVLDIRLHYILGRGFLSATGKRFFLERK